MTKESWLAANTLTPDKIALARRVVAAHEEARGRGQGVVVVDGTLVENLHVEEARRSLALHEAIAARG